MKKLVVFLIVLAALSIAVSDSISQSWRLHYANGIRDMKKELYYSAINSFSTAIELCPAMPDFYFQRALAYYKIKEFDRAQSDFDAELRLDSNSAGAHYYKAKIYKEQNNIENALVEFQQALLIDSLYHATYYNIGLIFKDMKQYEKAIENFNYAIELCDDNDLYYINRADCFFELRRDEDAVADLEKAYQIYPHYTYTRLSLGYGYSLIAEYEKAVGILTELFSEDSSSSWAYQIRGSCYIGLGYFELALKDFENSISLDTNNYSSKTAKALTFMQMNEFDKALMVFDAIKFERPEDSTIYSNLAYCYLEKFDLINAIYYFELSLKYDSANFDAIIGLAQSYYQRNEKGKAKQYFNQALKLEPSIVNGLSDVEAKGYFYTELNKKLIAAMTKEFCAKS